MARIFITGSSDGLGLHAARRLISRGHRVTLHARNAQRARDAVAACPGAEDVLVADLSSVQETRELARRANEMVTGREGANTTTSGSSTTAFDVVVHNAGLFRGGVRRTTAATADIDVDVDADATGAGRGGNSDDDGIGLPSLIAVNTLAPYILTCLMNRPKRIIFVTSGLHSGGDASLKDLTWQERGDKGYSDWQAYSDSKLHDILFAKAFARKYYPDTWTAALDPGWYATKLGGSGGRDMDDVEESVNGYVALVEGEEGGIKGKGSGKYFRSGARDGRAVKSTDDEAVQEKLLTICEGITGVKVPKA